jgi:hypothetical protein
MGGVVTEPGAIANRIQAFNAISKKFCAREIQDLKLNSRIRSLSLPVLLQFPFCGLEATLVYQISKSLKQYRAIGHRHFGFYYFFQCAQNSRRSG